MHALLAQDAVFPHFDQVKAEHVVPGIRQLLTDLHGKHLLITHHPPPTLSAPCLTPACCPAGPCCALTAAEIDKLEASVTPSWAGLVEPLERISDRHQRVWGVVSHLKGVRDSEELRKARVCLAARTWLAGAPAPGAHKRC